MNDLHPVIFFEDRPPPFISAHYHAVQLDGHALGRKRELKHQVVQRRACGHVAIVTVDLDSQEICRSGVGGKDDAAQFGRLSVVFSLNQNRGASRLEIRKGQSQSRDAAFTGSRAKNLR